MIQMSLRKKMKKRKILKKNPRKWMKISIIEPDDLPDLC